MNKLVLVAAAALTAGAFGVGLANAADPTFTKADANNDGFVSMAEAQGVFPNLTQDLFTKADANGDGKLDEAEFGALVGLTGALGDSKSGSSSAAASTSASASASSGG